MATKKDTAPAAAAVLDFSNVSEGGQTFNKKRVPAGDYLAKITKVESKPTKETKEPQWLWTIELQSAYTDRKFPYYCKLVENQLWKVRNLFLAAGKAVPKKKMKVDPNVIVGKLIAITLDDDEYDGKAQSNIVAIFPANELDDSTAPDEDEEEETEDEEEDEDTDDDSDDDTDEDEDGEEEDEDEEEAPAPPKKAAKAKIPAQKTASAKAKKPAATVSDDELEELDLDDI